MSKLNERLTLIANLSVVAGIVFLAAQMRQDTQAIQAQTRDAITEKQMEYLGWRATRPELALISDRIASVGYEALSVAEAQQWNGLIVAEFREWENSQYQFERGLFTPEDFEPRRERWRRAMSPSFQFGDAYRRVWAVTRDYVAPSFRAEIDRIVAEVETAQ